MRKSARIRNKIKRDKELKLQKRIKDSQQYSFKDAYKLQNYVRNIGKCLKGVSWKASVQNYRINCLIKIYNDYIITIKGMLPKPVSDRIVTIHERGKARTITPIHIKDRMVQKLLCDSVLVPILSKKLIYDNGASLKGKGVEFTRSRLQKHLVNAVKRFGSDFYVLSFDFKSFFDSIPHSTCRRVLEKYIADDKVLEFSMEIIKSPQRIQINKIKDIEVRKKELRKLDNDECCGICLGSQVSQIIALIIANDIDHYIKDVMGFKFYVRYMDDGVIFAKTKEELQELFEGLKKICDSLGLKFNLKKTHITKVSKGFTFLKVRYRITATGKIIKTLTRKGIVRMRRKLKKFRKKVDERIMTLDNVYDSMQSWLAHARVAQSHKTVRSMMKLYNDLFGGYRIAG